MSHHTTALADAVIDSREFAQRGERREGEIPVVRLVRLADMLADTAGVLSVELAGEQDGEGFPCLRMKIAGTLQLRCQRCLGAMALAVAIDNVVRLVEDVAMPEASDEEELDAAAPDEIVAERELKVLPLLEDEILLSLPLAPRHERCESPLEGKKDRASSPFAVLAQLKTH